MASDVLSRGMTFLYGHARALERRIYGCVFEAEPASSVADAVRAYRNADGGFGHSLEADLRCPTSQPIFVEEAFRVLRDGGASGAEFVDGACAFLATVANDAGAVPYVTPDALTYPRADHWDGDFATAPSLHATTGVAGRLHQAGASHEWLDRATTWCFDEIDRERPVSVHRIKNAMIFLENAPDRARADALYDDVMSQLPNSEWFIRRPPVKSYGLTPLHYAPRPCARSRPLFEDADVEAHLDALIEAQQADGGWPIHWSPPEGGATSEWRGRWTLEALLTLRAYGRI